MPPSRVWVSRRRTGFLSLVSPNRRSPSPSATGKIFSRSSSARSCSIRVYTSWKLPAMTISAAICCFSAETPVSTWPLSPVELFQPGWSRVCGHDVLGQAVQPVRQLAAARWPPRGEPLVAAPAKQQGPGGQRLVERELGQLRAVFDQADPAAVPEAFVTGRVLDDSVERDVLAHHDLSHVGSPLWLLLSAAAAAGGAGGQNRCAGRSFRPCPAHHICGGGGAARRDRLGRLVRGFCGRPGSRSARARPRPASTAQARKADW